MVYAAIKKSFDDKIQFKIWDNEGNYFYRIVPNKYLSKFLYFINLINDIWAVDSLIKDMKKGNDLKIYYNIEMVKSLDEIFKKYFSDKKFLKNEKVIEKHTYRTKEDFYVMFVKTTNKELWFIKKDLFSKIIVLIYDNKFKTFRKDHV